MRPGTPTPPTYSDIVRAACARHGVSTLALSGRSRDPRLVMARRAIAYCLRERLGWTMPDIADVLLGARRKRAVVWHMLRAEHDGREVWAEALKAKGKS